MDERRLEMKVGVLLLSAVAGLVALAWVMGELSLSRDPALFVELSHTGNVAEGAPVKLGGVEVGRVEKIRLQAERRDEQGQALPVRMALSLRDEVFAALHADLSVEVATRGPLGEAYLELRPGSVAAPALERGAVVRAKESARLEEIAARLGALLDSAATTLEGNPQGLASLVAGVGKLSENLGDVVGENKQELHGLIDELGKGARELRELAQLAKVQLQPGGKTAALIEDASASAKQLRRDLPPLTDNATRALAGLAAISGEFTAEDGKRLRASVERIASASEKLDQIAIRGERILARIEAGEGTVGGLVKDDQLHRDLKELVADLKKNPWKVLWKN